MRIQKRVLSRLQVTLDRRDTGVAFAKLACGEFQLGRFRMRRRLRVLEAGLETGDFGILGFCLLSGQFQLRFGSLPRAVSIQRGGLKALQFRLEVSDAPVALGQFIGGVFQLSRLGVRQRLRILQFSFQTERAGVLLLQLRPQRIQFRGRGLPAALSVLRLIVAFLQGRLHAGNLGVLLRQAIPRKFQLGVAGMNGRL